MIAASARSCWRGLGFWTLAAGLAVAASAGCGSSQPTSTVTLDNTRSKQAYTQTFPVGIADIHDDGNADLLFACQTPCRSGSGPSVQQVVHIHLQWQMGFTVKKANRDIAENAVIRWYVTPAGQSDASTVQLVEYTGSGLVEMKRDGDDLSVNIVQASMSPTTVTSKMADPVGTCQLSGNFIARKDRAAVTAQLGELRAAIAAARPAGNNSAAARIE